MELQPLKVFIIYAHEDRAFKDDLLKSLKLLQKKGLVAAWHDRDLMAGDDWEKVILGHLQSAHIILPIISMDFFNSDFIERVEIKEAFQRYEKGEAHILPIIARPCKWTDDPHISTLQALPEDGRPIARWESHDEAYESVYDGIKAKILNIHEGLRLAAQVETERKEDETAFSAARTQADFEIYLENYDLYADQARKKIEAFKNEEEKLEDEKRQAKIMEKQRLAEEMRQIALPFLMDSLANFAGQMGIYPELIPIKGGTFLMGDVFDEGEIYEKPVHSVTIRDFYLGTHPVTFKEYDRFCEESYRAKPKDAGWGRGSYPVINVSWEDAQAYCQWLSKKIGKKCRLPTEAEWEYAAREGGKKVRFGNGKDVADPAEINFNGKKDYQQSYSLIGISQAKTVVVGVLNSPNSLGLHDLSGNVWEWCADWYGAYPASAEVNPIGPENGMRRVLRGGSWRSYPKDCRSANRDFGMPRDRTSSRGFRVAASFD